MAPELLLIVLAPIISVTTQEFVAHYRHLSREKGIKQTGLFLHLAGFLQDVFLNIGVFYQYVHKEYTDSIYKEDQLH